MSGNRDSGYTSGKGGRESGRYGRSSGYGTDPTLYSYNSPLRQTADSPPSRRRSYLSDREDRPRSRFDEQPRRYEDPPSSRYDSRFRRDYEDRPRVRDFEDRPRSNLDFDSRSRSRDYDDIPRSSYSYRSDSPGSAPGTLTSSLRSRRARDDPEKSYCAMAGDYLRPNDYEGHNVNPRFKDDYSSMRKKRNTAADDLVKAVLARDALEQDFMRRRPRYSTEAHGMDSPPEEHSLHDVPLKSGLILGRPVMRDDRPYDSLPADWEGRRSGMPTRSMSCDDPPDGSITPTPDMYRSFSPTSSVSSSSSYSVGPYTYCETPPANAPPPPAYERRFLDGVLCSPSSSMPSTPSGSIPTTPTGNIPTPTKGPRSDEHPLARASSTPTSPNYEPGPPRYNTARPSDKMEDYDDRTTRSESSAPRKNKKGSSRKGLMGMFDSDWGETGSLLREVLDRSLGKSLFEDEEDHDRSWDEDRPDGSSQTREKTYDLPDGRKCHVKETRSCSSPDRDRNLFDKYRFKFGSFGSFDDADEDETEKEKEKDSKDTIEFVDFDDLVRKLREKPNIDSPFNSMRRSPGRRSPVGGRRSPLAEERQRQNYYNRRPSGESEKSSKEKVTKDQSPKVDKERPESAAAEKKKSTESIASEKKDDQEKENKKPKHDEVSKSKETPEVKEEEKKSPKEKQKKVRKPPPRDDTSPPIDLVSQENEARRKELERSPPLGRSKVPIPLPYKKISKDKDHDCDASHYNHLSDCPEDCRLTCHHKCRPNVSLDCNSTAQDNLEENNKDRKKSPVKRRQSGRADDADSGYHTGESTLRDHTPGELTLTREELRKNIDAFNDNQHGLIMTLNEETATFQGFIRVHMNLMRPISMSLPSRPTSIYDVVGSDCDSDEPPCETLTTSFYLPKDTTKVIHISSATTTQDVIKALLQKFKITDNPRKFALYEKIENEGAKATMRRLLNEEKPLPLCLSWTAEGLESHKYVLQENEPGEIVWEAFSIPELENFLKILDREEDEYVDQMKAKYKLLKIQIERQMKTLLAEGETQSASCTAGPPGGSHTSFDGDSREPVYV